MRSWRRALRYWRADGRGAAAVELAMVLPVMTALLLGGWELTKLVITYRKLCDSTAALANIMSQSSATTYSGDVQTLMAAAAQVMYPDSTTNMTVAVTQINIDGKGNATVGWSQGWNGGATYTTGSSWQTNLPSGLFDTNMANVNNCAATTATCYSYLYVQTTYSYQVTLGSAFIGSPVPLSNSVYIPPRNESEIDCSNCNSNTNT